MRLHEEGRAYDSVEDFHLSFFRDQFLELRHDLVPPRHHRLYFLFTQIVLGFFSTSLPSRVLSFSSNCRSQRTRSLGSSRFMERRKARVKSTLQIFQSSPISTLVRLASVSYTNSSKTRTLIHLFVPGVRIRSRQFLLVALHLVHLHRQPPTQRTRVPCPFAFDINRQHVINAKQLSQPISRDVVLVRIDEAQFGAADRSASWLCAHQPPGTRRRESRCHR